MNGKIKKVMMLKKPMMLKRIMILNDWRCCDIYKLLLIGKVSVTNYQKGFTVLSMSFMLLVNENGFELYFF